MAGAYISLIIEAYRDASAGLSSFQRRSTLARRKVTNTGKDSKREITSIANPGQSWSPRKLSEAISDIESGAHTYYVEVQSPAVDVRVVNGPKRKHLQTTADARSPNNLDNLPD